MTDAELGAERERLINAKGRAARIRRMDILTEEIRRDDAAIADTHPKDGDVEQAPLVSGGGAEQSPKHSPTTKRG